MKTTFTILAIVLMNVSFAQQPIPEGKKVFESKCAKCHGKNGGRGFFGAADLRVNRLSDPELLHTISKGKNRMPSWEKRLNAGQIKSVITYIKTLRK